MNNLIVVDNMSLIYMNLETELVKLRQFNTKKSLQLGRSFFSVTVNGKSEYLRRVEMKREMENTAETEMLTIDQCYENNGDIIARYYTNFPRNLEKTVGIAKVLEFSNPLLDIMQEELPNLKIKEELMPLDLVIQSGEVVLSQGINFSYGFYNNIHEAYKISKHFLKILVQKDLAADIQLKH